MSLTFSYVEDLRHHLVSVRAGKGSLQASLAEVVHDVAVPVPDRVVDREAAEAVLLHRRA